MATTVVKTIGTASRDYSTIQAWEDAAPANLVTADQIWEGQVYREGGGTNGEWTVASTLYLGGSTSDATRYKHLTAAAGESFADNSANPLRYNTATGVAIRATSNYANATVLNAADANLRISRLQFADKAGQGQPTVKLGNSVVADTCVLAGSLCAFSGNGYVPGVVVKNSVLIAPLVGYALWTYVYSVTNCTALGSAETSTGAYGGTLLLKNCALFGFTSAGAASASSSYNATSLASFPGTNNLLSRVTADEVVEPTAGSSQDLRLKSTSTLINAGTATGAPATDIFGTARPSGASYDIGAMEYVAAGGTTNAGITQADGSDTTALAVTVTTGAAIGNVDAADTQIITAANWTTAQLSGSIGADTTAITATAWSVTNASIGQTDRGDATAITAANWTTALIAHGGAADTTSIATAVTTGAGLAASDGADTTAITGNIVGVTNASVAVTDATDAQAIATLVTTGAVIVGTDGADSALAAAACWTTAILGASDAGDVTSITGSVAQGTAIYPLAADVRLGITYGPTGTDYVGTLTGGSGPSAADIAAAVRSDLALELARIDAAITSRATVAQIMEYTGP